MSMNGDETVLVDERTAELGLDEKGLNCDSASASVSRSIVIGRLDIPVLGISVCLTFTPPPPCLLRIVHLGGKERPHTTTLIIGERPHTTTPTVCCRKTRFVAKCPTSPAGRL